MNTYTVQDITNRLEDLDTYLDALEPQLENALVLLLRKMETILA